MKSKVGAGAALVGVCALYFYFWMVLTDGNGALFPPSFLGRWLRDPLELNAFRNAEPAAHLIGLVGLALLMVGITYVVKGRQPKK